ncbi:MAG: hypothetical protein ACYTF0_02380 [Planctomycetota bacterium]|jgi:hypothetical protein
MATTPGYSLIQRIAISAALIASIVVAVVVAASLGNPLGQAIGHQPFTATASRGLVSVTATTNQDRAEDVAAWCDRWLLAAAEQLGYRPAPIRIALFDSRNAYRAYGRAYVPGFNPQMDYCYSRAQRTVYAYDQRDRDLRPRLAHEALHALLHRRAPTMALWLDEGICELFEGYHLNDEGGLTLAKPQTDWLRMCRRIADDERHSPARLPGLSSREFYGRNSRNWYALSYGIALLLDRGGRLGDAIAGEALVLDSAAWRQFMNEPEHWYQPPGDLLDSAFHAGPAAVAGWSLHAH